MFLIAETLIQNTQERTHELLTFSLHISRAHVMATWPKSTGATASVRQLLNRFAKFDQKVNFPGLLRHLRVGMSWEFKI